MTCKPHKVSLSTASHLIFFFSSSLIAFPLLLSSYVSVDFGCFAIITGVRKRIEASNSVVYAVITQGIYLCFSQCTSREKNSTNFIDCGEMHGSEKTSLFNASRLKVADFACACLLNSMPAIFMMYSHFSQKYTLRNKGTKAVTVAVPFQKEHFCTY